MKIKIYATDDYCSTYEEVIENRVDGIDPIECDDNEMGGLKQFVQLVNDEIISSPVHFVYLVDEEKKVILN